MDKLLDSELFSILGWDYLLVSEGIKGKLG